MLSRFCCMKLNTAGVVIGWLGSALSLLGLVVYGLMLSRLDELAKYFVENVEPKTSEESAKKVIIIILTLNLTVTLVNLIASSLLVAGTIKERHLMIIPWLINSGISVLFSCIYYVYFVITTFNSGASLGSILLSIGLSGCMLTFQFLVWYAIYSLFKTIQAKQEHQRLLANGSNGSNRYPSYTKI